MKVKKKTLLKKSNVKKAQSDFPELDFYEDGISNIRRKLESDTLSPSQRKKLQNQLFDLEDGLMDILRYNELG
tara:strand:+ start:498 stop:716 length:219 start_codon:yes stop_codon:yes gene_type:complete